VSRGSKSVDAPEQQRGFQLRATFKFVDDPNLRSQCEVIPRLEVFSKQNGGTLFMYPGLAEGFNPQPDPPGQN